MEVQTEQSNAGVAILRLQGSIQLTTARVLREAIDQAASEGAKRILLDMQGVAFVDSTGLGLIVGKTKSFRQIGGELRLFNLATSMQSLLRLGRFDSLLHVFGSEAEALVFAG